MVISLQSAVARLLTAMLIGLIIGSEREGTHRPAGLRTHMLVALGACLIMVTGQMMWHDFTALGGSPDPARLAAQVIPGVGFLGAGTILREGFSIKGLTTAASLWATACMGLCAGAGFYAAALTCAVAVYITLTIFRMLQKRMMGGKGEDVTVQLVCPDGEDAAYRIRQLANKYGAELNGLEQITGEDEAVLNFHVHFSGAKQRQRELEFLCHLGPATRAIRLDSTVEAMA